MRSQGHTNGLAANELIDGDAQSLSFGDESFDLVCEFAFAPHPESLAKLFANASRRVRVSLFQTAHQRRQVDRRNAEG
jgi:hypothetical protein